MAKEKDDTQKVNSEKLKALQLTMEKIEKSYGKGSIMRMATNLLMMYRLSIPVQSHWIWPWELGGTPKVG